MAPALRCMLSMSVSCRLEKKPIHRFNPALGPGNPASPDIMRNELHHGDSTRKQFMLPRSLSELFRRRLTAQANTTSTTAPIHNSATTFCLHPCAKTVNSPAALVMRLIGAFHRLTPRNTAVTLAKLLLSSWPRHLPDENDCLPYQRFPTLSSWPSPHVSHRPFSYLWILRLSLCHPLPPSPWLIPPGFA